MPDRFSRYSPPTPAPKHAAPFARGAALAGTVLSSAGILGLAAIQYGTPPIFTAQSHWGLNSEGVRHFAESLFGVTFETFDTRSYILLFRCLLSLAYVSYGMALLAALQGGVLSGRLVLPWIVALSLGLAVLCPPSLSNDSYAYVAYARMQVLHGANPYVEAPQVLVAAGDPIVHYLSWDMPSVYGPVWLMTSFGLIAGLPAEALWLQVLAMKLVEAIALIAAALVGRQIAEHFNPRKGDLALYAIGLNPLFLVEGPGNGHNDLLMMTLVLVSILCFVKKRYLVSGVVLGLAVGVKFVPLALLPWMMLEAGRDLHWRAKLKLGLLLTALTLLPLVIAYAPLYQGAQTWQAFQRRAQIGLNEEELAREAQVRQWFLERGAPESALPIAMLLYRQWPVLLLYVGLTLWLLLRPAPGHWLDAWAVLALGLNVWSMGIWFPWYIIWPWMTALVRWDKPRVHVSFACFCLALGLCWRYVVLKT